jgi:outer membrane immunogenic protein
MRTHELLKLVLVTTTLSSVMLASAATVSDAADSPRAPVYRVPPPLPPYYLWSGFYVGAHVGSGWFDSNGVTGTSGFIGGGQVGYNFQMNNWVFGLEADLSGTTIGGSVGGPFVGASWGVDWASTLTTKVGYAFDRWLVYGKVGAGWIHSSASVSVLFLGNASFEGTTSAAVFGVGTEYALGSNWSAKVEYNVFDLGNDSVIGTSTFQTLKAGVNYKLGPGWPF